MPVSIQGNWNLNVTYKQPGALPQRFIVTGAISGNGTYPGVVGSSVSVVGSNWQVNIQANETYEEDGQWINSTIFKGPVQTSNGQNIIDLQSEDFINDGTFDLNLRLTQPAPVIPPPVTPPPITPLPPPIIPPVTPPPVVPVPTTTAPLGVGKVYTKITEGDRLPKQIIKETFGIFLDYTGSNTGNLLTFHTCSNDSGSFKRSIYQSQCFTCSSKPQFDIAYGHDGGSGSNDLGGYDWASPSNAVYGQYRSLCLSHPIQRFNIGSKEIHHFYAINVKRDRMKDRLDEGNVELNLAQLSGSLFEAGGGSRNAHTGSNVKVAGTGKIIRLIDDSRLNLENLSSNAYSTFYQPHSQSKAFLTGEGGDYYYMVSGSIEQGIYNNTQPHVYGLMYPKLGLMLLDADLMDLSASFLTVTGSDVSGDNYMKMFTAISGAALYTDESGDYLGFQARKVKYSYREQYFIRVKNSEYNFSNNPTFVTGSDGQIITDLSDKPQTYITAIGLYNDNHDCLAVAKISSPIYKSYTDEALFEVSLNYE